ncbi:MAG: YraN family protein [Bacteroidota bacterium]
MGNNLEKGKEGEQLATQFLMEKGYQILTNNYRYKRGEIDLIALHEHFLVFVEVKLRRDITFGYPEEAVDTQKAKRIIQTAEQYILQHNWQGDIRFDIIAIVQSTLGEREISHFEDAFY